MGKWFGSVVATLVLLVLTSAVATGLKGPIDDYFSGNRLTATVQLSPWIEKPTGAAPAAKASDSSASAMLKKIQEDMRAELQRSSSPDDYGVVRVTVANESSKTVTKANFRLEDTYTADEGILQDAKGAIKRLGRTNRVTLPDLDPGDRITVYLWRENFSSLLFPMWFKTYSSEGAFRVRYLWPESQDRTFETGLGKFLNDWASLVLIGSGVLLLALLGIYVAVSEAYYKALLKSELFYQTEKQKYDANPKKFSPDLTSLST